MQTPLPHIKHFCSQDAANIAVCETLASIIKQAVTERGKAWVFLSGGSTPKHAYKLLFALDLPWEHVVIMPVDDRYVAETDAGSNYGMMKTLLKGSAAEKSVTLINIVPKAPFNNGMLRGFENLMPDMQPDVCLMGMGTDGHTASWFPGSNGLETALNADKDLAVTAIDATRCPGAGDFPHRVSFTLQSIMKSKNIILFITGKEKAGILKDALCKPVKEAPVKALFDAGSRLSIMWAP